MHKFLYRKKRKRKKAVQKNANRKNQKKQYKGTAKKYKITDLQLGLTAHWIQYIDNYIWTCQASVRYMALPLLGRFITSIQLGAPVGCGRGSQLKSSSAPVPGPPISLQLIRILLSTCILHKCLMTDQMGWLLQINCFLFSYYRNSAPIYAYCASLMGLTLEFGKNYWGVTCAKK